MRASFKNAPSPVAAGVVREKNVAAAIGAIKNNMFAGAGAIDLHLSSLDNEYRNVESIKKILDSTHLPVLVLNYSHNYDLSPYSDTEENRVALLEMGAEAGASCVDIQGYTFNTEVKTRFQEELATPDMLFAAKKPKEVALDEATIKKQTEFIEKMHAQGTEVLLSCHTQVNLNTEECVCLVRFLEKRGADIIKIVIPCNNDEELAENFRTMIALKNEITSCKISFHCAGSKGKLTRIVNPMLGSHLAFCVERYGINAHSEQIHLKSFADAIRTLDWREFD